MPPNVTDTMEGDWKFMAGLGPLDDAQMRRVAAKILKNLKPQAVQPIGRQYNYKILTKQQRARVNIMCEEASDDNPLLHHMLVWFAKKYNVRKSKGLVEYVQVIVQRVNAFVRYPRKYREEYKAAVQEWKGYLELFDGDTQFLKVMDFKEMLGSIEQARIVKRALAKRDREDAGLPEVKADFTTVEDGMDTEKEQVEEVLPTVKRKRSVAKPKKKSKPKPKAKPVSVSASAGMGSTTGTRSGKYFRSAPVEMDELERVLEQSRVEALANN